MALILVFRRPACFFPFSALPALTQISASFLRYWDQIPPCPAFPFFFEAELFRKSHIFFFLSRSFQSDISSMEVHRSRSLGFPFRKLVRVASLSRSLASRVLSGKSDPPLYTPTLTLGPFCRHASTPFPGRRDILLGSPLPSAFFGGLNGSNFPGGRLFFSPTTLSEGRSRPPGSSNASVRPSSNFRQVFFFYSPGCDLKGAKNLSVCTPHLPFFPSFSCPPAPFPFF